MTDEVVSLASPDSKSFIDALIDDYAPKNEVVEVTIKGKKLTFRTVSDRAQLNIMKKAAQKFAAEVDPLKVPNESDRVYYDTDEDTFISCYMMSSLSVEPKLQPLDLLKLAKLATLGFEAIRSAYSDALEKEVVKGEVQGVADAKKDSSTMSAEETG